MPKYTETSLNPNYDKLIIHLGFRNLNKRERSLDSNSNIIS